MTVDHLYFIGAQKLHISVLKISVFGKRTFGKTNSLENFVPFTSIPRTRGGQLNKQRKIETIPLSCSTQIDSSSLTRKYLSCAKVTIFQDTLVLLESETNSVEITLKVNVIIFNKDLFPTKIDQVVPEKFTKYLQSDCIYFVYKKKKQKPSYIDGFSCQIEKSPLCGHKTIEFW